MSEKKRAAKSVVSPKKPPGDKKRKNQKENEDKPVQGQSKPKIAYNFGPINKISDSTPLKQIQLQSNRQQGTHISTPTYNFLQKQNHNSPPSEDYVFWASTPKIDPNIKPAISSEIKKQQIPSSPLQSKSSPLNPASYLPPKFQSINFNNFSGQKSPENKRRSVPSTNEALCTSEIKKPQSSTTKSKHLLFHPFSVGSSAVKASNKKKDMTALINCFEPPSSTLNNNELYTPSKPQEPNISKEGNFERKSRLNFELSSDSIDDDFSSDILDDLEKVLEKKRPESQVKAPLSLEVNANLQNIIPQTVEPRLKKELDDVIIKLTQEKLTETKADSDSDDTLTDDVDDSLFEQLLEKKLTQLPKITTQEANIRKVDREGHLIFKNDIHNIDSANHTGFKRTEENLAKCAFEKDGIHRFQVLNVMNNHYFQNKEKKDQSIITVADSKDQHHKIFLRDFWLKLDIEPKDVIHIIGDSYKIIDKDSDNLLIWNPDIMLSATLLGDAINCDRRSVLSTRLEGRGDYNKFLVIGEIVHTIFESVLKDSDCSLEYMRSVLESELDAEILKILTSEETKETIRAEVNEHLPYIKTWYELYVRENPQTSSSVKISYKREKTLFSASNIIDIEENIWSPAFGLRGLIDVTIEAHLRGVGKHGKFIAPLELKSGSRAQISHKAQASLYTLLMNDRYDTNVEFFMLVYTKLKETTKYEINKRELKELIIIRNQLTKYMKEGERNLPPLKQSSVCDNCAWLSECMTINYLSEAGTPERSGLADGMYETLTGHLNNNAYSNFYNYWDDLLTKEESSVKLLGRDLFLLDGETREKTSGKCLAGLALKDSPDDDMEENGSFRYIFHRKKTDQKPLNTSQLAKHDRVLVSDEVGHFALCSGFIENVRANEVIIKTNRRLKNHHLKIDGFNSNNNQTYQTFLKAINPTQHADDKITYRIDKDDMFHGMKTARHNILNLFTNDGDHRRRELIVDNRPPEFTLYPLKYNLETNHTFNEDQIKAFDKVLSAKDYALLLGMPGTGKTTVIAQLIRFLVENKKTVLLTAYTHSAVDNILMKMKNDGIGIVRLGHMTRIHKDVQCFSPDMSSIRTKKELNEAFLDPPVVATTCLGTNDWCLRKRRFDYCIADESSQVSMPVSIGPLAFCDKFVLVGDHYQLPPLVQNPEARVGLSKSLFKMLADAHPDSLVELTHQYRMCNDIMLLTNTLIYEGRLKCGNDDVANQCLKIPNASKLKDALSTNATKENEWLATVLNEDKKVLFLNHDNVGGCEESSIKENIENQKEALLIFQIVEAMLSTGVPEESIGVMSFYRAQLRLFYRMFTKRKNIEMLTADQFQGRDKECVIISLVKSNDRNDAGSLLKEWRRVNVAITRAKSKLVIVGSRRTLQNLRTIDAFMNILLSRGWFYDLPQGADLIYNFMPPSLTNLEAEKKTNVKPFKDSKVVQKHPLIREISEEMGIDI